MHSHDENAGTEFKPEDVLGVEWDPVEPEAVLSPTPHTEPPGLDEKFADGVSTGEAQRSSEGPQFGDRAFTLRELKSLRLERPAEIVANILYEGETVALVARPKTGKTRLMQQLAVAVARGPGAEFLGPRRFGSSGKCFTSILRAILWM